jgi:hypothetical protein
MAAAMASADAGAGLGTTRKDSTLDGALLDVAVIRPFLSSFLTC